MGGCGSIPAAQIAVVCRTRLAPRGALMGTQQGQVAQLNLLLIRLQNLEWRIARIVRVCECGCVGRVKSGA